MQFTVKKIKKFSPKDELLKIGFDSSYIDKAIQKHKFVNILIENIPFYCATIIKESALSNGADAGVNRGVLNHSVEFSSVLLSGSVRQLEKVAISLKFQPFNLSILGDKILSLLNDKVSFPKIMGILNITDNSFSDGGKYLEPKSAIAHAIEMIKCGVNIIDIGAEATNPNSSPISDELEIQRLKPILSEIKNLGVSVSVDTRNSKTAEFALNNGADIINDVSGLSYDKNMLDIVKNSNSKIVLMHSKGTPQTMDKMCNYNDIVDDIFNFLKEKIEFLNSEGIDNDRIIADMGLGFAKNNEQNFNLLNRIYDFNSLEVGILIGASRKRFLKSIINEDNLDKLDDLTMLTSFYLFSNKVDIVRVHNVSKTKLALDFYNAIYAQKPYP